MFILYANKNQLTVRKKEPITSGSVNANTARFEFSSDWDGLTRNVVFQAGGIRASVLLDESGVCDVPWEVLKKPLVPLEAGVYGTRDDTVLPTVWANLGIILPGAAPGDGTPPTLELLRLELAKKGDGLSYDGLNLSLKSGEKTLSTVQIAGGGGISDHRLLSNRDAEEQHPIESIIGLSQRLDKTLTSGDYLTVSEILKIMEV